MPGNNWMTGVLNAEAEFANRPLHQITIPGTHDAGCYEDRGNNFLSRTQTQNINQQLTGGIRYFDIRPYRNAQGQYWTYHGWFYLGGRLDGHGGIIEQVQNFLAHPNTGNRELVILNISHFSHFDDTAHVDLIDLLQQALGAHLVPHTQTEVNLFNTPYETLLTDQAGNIASRVAILYDGALDTNKEQYVTQNNLPKGFFKLSPKYNSDLNSVNPIFLFDQYANSAIMNSDLLRTGMVNDQMRKLNQRQNYTYTGEGWGGGLPFWTANGVASQGISSTLHLFSWTLTPQPYTDPVTAAQNTSNPALLAQFTGNNWANNQPYSPTVDKAINIIYVDDYASEQYQGQVQARANLAMPVAICDFLNRKTNWAGWGGF